MEVIYEILSKDRITRSLFQKFNRYQKVTRCWRKEQDIWILKNIDYVEDWSEAQYEFLVKCLKNTVETGGFVFGCFDGSNLLGFTSVENKRFGSRKQYVQLSCIHVSFESRGKSLGKGLFGCAVLAAQRLGAKKLYISAHSSEETQLFYHAMGCIEAKEYNKELTEAEPCDCQLEYVIKEEIK